MTQWLHPALPRGYKHRGLALTSTYKVQILGWSGVLHLSFVPCKMGLLTVELWRENGVIFVHMLCDHNMLCPLCLLNIAVFLSLKVFEGEIVLFGDGCWRGPISVCVKDVKSEFLEKCLFSIDRLCCLLWRCHNYVGLSLRPVGALVDIWGMAEMWSCEMDLIRNCRRHIPLLSHRRPLKDLWMLLWA